MGDVIDLQSPHRVKATKKDRQTLANILRRWADDIENCVDEPETAHLDGVVMVAVSAQDSLIFTDHYAGPGCSCTELLGAVDLAKAKLVKAMTDD